jgi:hypothetical protein
MLAERLGIVLSGWGSLLNGLSYLPRRPPHRLFCALLPRLWARNGVSSITRSATDHRRSRLTISSAIFEVDLEKCLQCGAPMKLRAVITEPGNVDGGGRSCGQGERGPGWIQTADLRVRTAISGVRTAIFDVRTANSRVRTTRGAFGTGFHASGRQTSRPGQSNLACGRRGTRSGSTPASRRTTRSITWFLVMPPPYCTARAST